MARKVKKTKVEQPTEAKWTKRELIDFTEAMQQYGSGDFKHIAEAVDSKSETDVKNFVKKSYRDTRNKITKSRPQPITELRRTRLLNLRSRPNVSKWRKLVFNQIDASFRVHNYSSRVMQKLIENFMEDEKEPDVSQVVNTKEIYKYILNCFNGEIPIQLPPVESYVVTKIIEDLKLITSQGDFNEEYSWLQEYDKKIVFVPKDFGKELAEEKGEDVKPSVLGKGKPIRMQDNLLQLLNEHKKVMQSFNPLTVPVWFLAKEQEIVSKTFKGS